MRSVFIVLQVTLVAAFVPSRRFGGLSPAPVVESRDRRRHQRTAVLPSRERNVENNLQDTTAVTTPSGSSPPGTIDVVFDEQLLLSSLQQNGTDGTGTVIPTVMKSILDGEEFIASDYFVPDIGSDKRVDTKSLSQTDEDGDLSETVNAILAASQEAVTAAEANWNRETSTTMAAAEAVKKSSGSPVLDPPTELEIVPASVVLSDESKKIHDKTMSVPEAPSVGKVLKFAIPAIGVWLCSPLLSLIDTSTVGLLSGTSQQAALNPAVAVTDYAALLIAFLYTATTNLVAAARETDRSVEGAPRTTNTLIGALQLSTYVGAGLGLLLFVLARPLLGAIIGNDGISPAVFDAAMKYVRIRSLGMPAAAVIGSAQAACLGMQDIRSPLYVLLVAALVNLVGDILFVGSPLTWLGGAAGAAWATVFSQYAAVTLFIHWLCHKAKPEAKSHVNVSEAIMELTGKPSSKGAERRQKFKDSLLRKTGVDKKKKEDSFSVRGFLMNRFRGRDLVKFPKKTTIADFAPYVAPVTTTQFGRVSGYVAMSHVVSSSLGTISMAAQQVIVSLFYCLTPIADSLSLTAQSFVPAIFEKKPSKARTLAMRQTILNFGKAGAVFGAAMVAAVSAVPLISRFFTSDPMVTSLVNMVVPWLAVVFSVHGALQAAEGLLMGQKDLNFLGMSYGIFFAVVPYFMLRVKKAALAGTASVNLLSVWKVFTAYQLVRFATWIIRVAIVQRRTERSTNQATTKSPNLHPLPVN